MDVQVKILPEISNKINICRCCLADGCYKDISLEYYVSGQKEVYENMLKDAFGLQIAVHNNGDSNNCSRYICEDCILRLRDAYNFKNMVLKSEDTFLLLIKTNLLEEENVNKLELKLEPLIEDDDATDKKFDFENEECFGEENNCDDDDDILANIKLELEKSENCLTTRKRRTKNNGNRKRKKTKIKDINGEDKLQNAIKEEKDWLKITERRGNGPLLRDNSLKLLANSTICVFQWNKSRYRCFCCNTAFSDMNLLKEHTNNTHTIENIEKKIISQQNRLVKVEISNLYCKICDRQVDSLISLKNHLKTHGIKMGSDEDLLVPFKINSDPLKCQICDHNFNTFRLLNIHMNRHFQKQVCHICGAGFSNLVFLNLHKSRAHRPVSCKQCNLDFKTKIDKKDHDIVVHDLKIERKLRFPCPYCTERFFQENFRVQHLIDKHGLETPEHKCTMCSKVFITRSLCNNHVKTVHLKEKNHECDVCHHLFYTKSDVARHRVTHTGEKRFSCTICNSLFATKDSLRRHMRRTHMGGHLLNK